MGLVDRLRGPDFEQRGLNPADDPYATWWRSALGAAQSFTGESITVEKSMQVDAVVACVQLLSGTVGAMTLKVYKGEVDGERSPVGKHPLTELFGRRPNPEMSPIVFWSVVMTNLLTEGDAFLGKTTYSDVDGRRPRIGELWPIRPQRVVVKREGGVKKFVIDGNHQEPYTRKEIIHVQGPSLDGVRGLSPIGLAREAIGAGLAVDEYTNRFFRNSAMPVGVLETDQELTDDAQKRLKRDWSRRHGGLKNAGKVAVLEQGLKFHAISLPLKDLEFVALQQLSAAKIARMFRVPASMIDAQAQQGKGLHYSSTANDDLQFLKHTVRPWLLRISQALMMDEDLFGDPTLFCEHEPKGLLQLDALTQAQVRQIEAGNKPWKLPSEIRGEDHMPPEANEMLDKALETPDPIEMAKAQAEAHAAGAIAVAKATPDKPAAKPADKPAAK